MRTSTRCKALAANLAMDVLYGSSLDPRDPFRQRVLWDDDGSRAVRRVLEGGAPCLIARFGSTELAAITYYTRWRAKGLHIPYVAPIRRTLWRNSGVFPGDDDSIDRFSQVYLSAASSADVMGVWFNRGEHRIVEEYCPNATLVQLEALNSVIRDDPWSSALEGRSVLVVHPFADTIASQYRDRRTLLFDDLRILPEFKLKTLTAVQTIAGNTSGFDSWFDALEHMRRQIAAIDFDIAIIGAGGYGLPLAATVKSMGRQAVHLGGATQLLFGIKGRRWEVESPDDVAPLFNEYWVRPSAEENPIGSSSVEGGCYW